MVCPDDIVIDGWDISSANLSEAMKRACVFDPEIQSQLEPYMMKLEPRPGIYDPDFIAANQRDRADHIVKGSKWEQCQQIINDIRDFKSIENLDKVFVVWTANTERFTNVIEGVHDTYENLIMAIKSNHPEVSPSTLFAFAAISTHVIFF